MFQPLSTRPEFPCKVTSLNYDYRPLGNGLIFQKGWPLTKLFNYHLLKMEEEGVINQLRRRWIRKGQESSCANRDVGDRVQARLDHVVTLFGLWAAGILLSGLVWTGEKVFQLRRNSSNHGIEIAATSEKETQL